MIRANRFVYQMVNITMYTFVMYEATTIALIIGAIAHGILSALGYLGRAGVVEMPREKK